LKIFSEQQDSIGLLSPPGWEKNHHLLPSGEGSQQCG